MEVRGLGGDEHRQLDMKMVSGYEGSVMLDELGFAELAVKYRILINNTNCSLNLS